MSAALKHPTVEAVIAIHAEVLAAHGGSPGLRSRELLESAVAAPQASMMGVPVMTEPIEIAAAYFFYLCSNHPFVDGNKRVGHAAAEAFLMLNGVELIAPVDESENVVVALAAGQLPREELLSWIRQHCFPLK